MQSVWYWKLAFFECASSVFITVSMVLLASLAQVTWSDIGGTAKFTICLSALVAGVKDVKSFLSTTMQTLKQNAPDGQPQTTLPENPAQPQPKV